MAAYNYFGATAAQVIAMYPGTVAANYGGTTEINNVLARISRAVAGAFAPEAYRLLADRVDLQMAVQFATDGQLTAQLGVVPIVAGTLHIWRLPRYNDLSVEPVWGWAELSGTVDVSTGIFSINGSNALVLGDMVFASYTIDHENAAFSWPSVADIVLLGAASEFGARLFKQGDQVWPAVQEYHEKYRGLYIQQEGGDLSLVRAGKWVPDELRGLRWWTDFDRSSTSMTSIEKVRA